MDFSIRIAKELNLTVDAVRNTIELLDEGASIPFIARYRKEATGSLNEVVITAIRDRCRQLGELEARREYILQSVREQGKLTADLEKKINEAETLYQLEDLYLPYKPKRKTRASVARERGLEPLAERIYAQGNGNPRQWAAPLVDAQKGVDDVEAALQGARDIIAEKVSEHEQTRARLRRLFERKGRIISKVIKGRELEGQKYELYFDNKEPVSRIPSHRLLAMLRGEEEGFLRVKVEPSEEEAFELLDSIHVKGRNEAAQEVEDAVTDAYKRLLQPQMETEMRQQAKVKADEEAIRVFADNVRQLLLAPPLGEKVVMGIDPGFRTGCKVVVLDRQGSLLEHTAIFPHPPVTDVHTANRVIRDLAKKYGVEAIAIGNGTAGRETEQFVRHVDFETMPLIVPVNENGASVYSASELARQEFPDEDITVRGAVSIGRRLMDPLAELIKIDPKSIGVGQYQHDVNQKKLAASLDETVSSCVDAVGVELNTASRELLAYVSGIGSALAANIVRYRTEHGGFHSKQELLKVPRFGEKAFEQAAGFIRVRDSANPLDRSAVHPESYDIAERMAASLQCTVGDLMADKTLRDRIRLEDFVTPKFGIPTLTDIMKELAKPGRDPREQFDLFAFDSNVRDITDLHVGMELTGVVVNIAAFGCFVDIGVHQDGLVHVSQMGRRRVRNPLDVVKLNQKIKVKVIGVDVNRKRISLSMNLD
ncbi:MAG: RNA-binding transcriptional accessory protein [Bacteroidales bacterium]|nr:RNA-binding transcriptional accessory protein [Bacteroidales bacterium]